MTAKLAVFDCDGTLVDGQADVLWAMARAFDQADQPQPDPARVRRMVGLSLPVAIRALAPEAADNIQRDLIEFYKAAFRGRREQGLLEEPLYEGIHDLLHSLHREGWLLAVATGKSDRGLQACLASHGLSELFISLQTADRHPSKPHPAMLEAALFEAGVDASDAVMIGDTSYDVRMGHSAHVRTIGVAWGYHSPAELNSNGAAAIVDDVAALRAELERWG